MRCGGATQRQPWIKAAVSSARGAAERPGDADEAMEMCVNLQVEDGDGDADAHGNGRDCEGETEEVDSGLDG